MTVVSPLSHADLRDIERALDEGETDDAAARLATLADCRDHAVAIDFLTTRLLFQRGRIDAAGATERVQRILEREQHFHEARTWLASLDEEQLDEKESSAPPSGRDETPTQPDALPPRARKAAARALKDELPRYEETDDDVTPAEPLDLEALAAGGRDRDSSSPPPRPDDPARGSSTTGTSGRMPFDTLGAKEQLQASAGRYRESLHPPPARSLSQAAGPPSQTPSAEALAAVEERIEAALEEARQGEMERAVELLPPPPTPDGLGAHSLTTLARLLLEVGDAERAATEARRALDADPQSRESQLLFAWCAVRYSRQRDDAWSLEQASELLKRIGPGPTPEAGLLEALRACVEARIGSASVAAGIAQRALRVNAESIDALAAMAEAAALTGESARAEMALEQLVEISEATAEQITPRLLRLGVGESAPTSSASVWLPVEHSLYSGARDGAREALEVQALSDVGPCDASRWQAAGEIAARAAAFLARAPVLRHFGPYDGSLASIARVEVGLGLLYGHAARSLPSDDTSRALWQACGFYVGEALVASCGGQWQEAPADLIDGCVQVFDAEVAPFQIVRNRLLHGKHARIPTALGPLLSEAPRVAQLHRSSSAVEPIPPWDDEPWPSIETLPRFGRALGHSVVATYCKDKSDVLLDRSAASLAALDDYLALVTPHDAPLDPASNWARWLAGFVGGYLGEVLCRELGAVWRDTQQHGASKCGVTVGLRTVTPVAWVLESISGTRLPLETLLTELRQAKR